jgi:hypothetical protein
VENWKKPGKLGVNRNHPPSLPPPQFHVPFSVIASAVLNDSPKSNTRAVAFEQAKLACTNGVVVTLEVDKVRLVDVIEVTGWKRARITPFPVAKE